MDLNRRRFLTTAGVLSAPLALAGCGFAPAASKPSTGSKTITFTTWGTDSELAGFKTLIAGFEKAHAGTKVALNAVPYEQIFTNIDAQLQAGNPPDIFRVPYYTFGSYAGAGQLLDLSGHVPSGFQDRFTPQAWAAVQNGGKQFGIPHHTDTNVIFYNKTALDTAGVTSVPTTLDDAWTWDEFTAVAAKLKAKQPKNRYPFAYNWQGNGVTRWLNWLFENNGRFLSADLKTAAIDSAAGRAAIDFTKSFFTKQFVPRNDSIGSTTYAADDFANQTVAMVFSGAFAIPDTSKLKFEWASTFAPQKVRHGGDFGGNALVATKQAAAKADVIGSFFDYVTQEAQMRAFCAGASLLPTRRDLVSGGIDFTVRPELSKVSVGQASTVQASDSGQVASPNMSKIITVLKKELDTAFVGGRGAAATASAAAAGITTAVGS
ncbi:ABC transporter substrate-binding protein [uncultured Amnibacterium sp.]|uniref:ABC transporter substrate-binding protein n=1 Tax=uncultured Amnibacterium sp. TaxID=1631851 RepID=UPI0035CC4A89